MVTGRVRSRGRGFLPARRRLGQPGLGYIFFRDDGAGAGPIAKNIGDERTDAIRERLSSVDCAKAAKGSLSIHLLMDADGRFKQVQLATTTGNHQVDQCIDSALTSMPRMNDPLPPGMPEQVNVKIVARI